MKILIIGRGGREHAIADKVAQDENTEVFVAPGNAGMLDIATLVEINELDTDELVLFAKKNKIDLTIVGPESALMNGIVDAFKTEGLKIFGPTIAASYIEGSKDYAKKLMIDNNIPTGFSKTFTEYSNAINYLKKVGAPIVIKYDGLAAGKGVVVAMTNEEAQEAVKNMLCTNIFKDSKILIEEYLEGPEFSLMAFVNGENVYCMEIAQDHKRAFDGDLGPNTGGMGAYSDVPLISDDEIKRSISEIMVPTAKALVKDNRSFSGILYGGIILTKDGPKTIEFNARFGDPETEVIMPRLENSLVQVINDVMNNKDPMLKWKNKKTLGIVMASKGYPGKYLKGIPILGLSDVDAKVYHMGTSIEDGALVSNGGRVLIVVGEGVDHKEARENATKELKKIKCDNLFNRDDIGYQIIDKKD